MAARRPQRNVRAPRRFGWEDGEDEIGQLIMNEESDNGGQNSSSDSESGSDNQSYGGSDNESNDNSNESSNESSNDSSDEDEAVGELEDWVNVDQDPQIPPFTGNPGVNLPPNADPTIMEACDFFFLFLGDDFFELLATETNRYAHQVLDQREFPPNSRVHKWHDTHANEMKAFIALIIAMGLDDRPSYSSYWSKSTIYDAPFWPSVMPRDRFVILMKFFHLVDNEAPRDGNRDKLYKVRPLIDTLNERFPALYSPERDICVDETMVPWTGRLSFKQYIPIKPHKYGIKLYQLCDSSSGYSLRFKVYQGREGNQVDRNHTMNVVLQLVQPWLNVGHLLWMDNYYSGVPLYEELRNRGTLAAGTVRLTRAGIPPILRLTKLRRGQTIFRRKGNLMAMKWQDSSDVKFLTTAHSATMVDGRKRDANGQLIQVPAIKLQYDLKMNGVDKNDQNVGVYAPRRKSLKWYVKLALYMVSLVRFQSFIIYKKTVENPVSQVQFIHELVISLVERAGLPQVQLGRPRGAPLQRLVGRHFPSIIPATANKDKPTKRCVVCCVPTGQRRQQGVHPPRRHESRYMCTDCGVALCIAPCFQLYHTYTDFKQAFNNIAHED